MNATQATFSRRLALVAIVVGALEAAFSAILGVAWFLPVFGLMAIALGVMSLHRASAVRAARALSIGAACAAALGLIALASLFWFLSHIEFTF